MWLYFRLFLIGLRLLGRDRQDLVVENLVLRQQLAVLTRSHRRISLQADDRRFWSTVARSWSRWRGHVRLVEPATVVRWHRTAWRRYWRWRSRAHPTGRRRIAAETRALIVRIARENPTWGARRIANELHALGVEVSRASVDRYRPPRSPSPSWRTFLRLQAPHIWASDLFTVQTMTFRTLYVFFLIAHDRREIVYWNVTRHPTAPWVWRQLLQATPWGQRPRYLIRDRDACYGDFVLRARAIRIETVLTLARAPQANAIAERVIGTIRRECLDHVIILGERHLRRIPREYMAYYNATRPHLALNGVPPCGPRPRWNGRGDVGSRHVRCSVASTTRTAGVLPDASGVLSHHNRAGPGRSPASTRWRRARSRSPPPQSGAANLVALTGWASPTPSPGRWGGSGGHPTPAHRGLPGERSSRR